MRSRFSCCGRGRNLARVDRDPTSASSLLSQAEQALARGDDADAMALFARAADRAEHDGDLPVRIDAVLGLAGGQQYNLDPGVLPVRLYSAYESATEPRPRARLAAALARCWAYASEARRARPFAAEALRLADQHHDPALTADCLDAAMTAHWGPDDLALRRDWAAQLADVAAHLPDPDARLQAHLWALTVAWEVLDLPRMHRSMRAIESMADTSPRAELFAATRRLPLELLRGRLDVAPLLIARATAAAEAAAIPDAPGVLHAMHGYTALFADDASGCAAEAPAFEAHAVDFGVAAVRSEAAVVWLGARRPDKVAEMVRVFTPDVLAGLPKDSDWLLILQCTLEAAIAVVDTEVIAGAVALLAPYAGRSVVNAGAVMWHGVTDDTLARGYAVLGDADAAAHHRVAALATYERIGAGWWRDRLREWPGVGTPPSTGAVAVHLHPQPGGTWLVGRASATVALPQMRGLRHLHALLHQPDTDISAAHLMGVRVVDQTGLDVLDDESRRVLRDRLAELDAQIARTDRSDLREERRAIAEYLAAGVGLGGRHRTTGSHAERARIAVRKSVVAALAKIAEADPWLGRHLHSRVRTGTDCRYDTDPDHPIHWILETRAHQDRI